MVDFFNKNEGTIMVVMLVVALVVVGLDLFVWRVAG